MNRTVFLVVLLAVSVLSLAVTAGGAYVGRGLSDAGFNVGVGIAAGLNDLSKEGANTQREAFKIQKEIREILKKEFEEAARAEAPPMKPPERADNYKPGKEFRG